MSSYLKIAAHLDVYSHHFSVTKFDDYTKNVVVKFAKNMGQWGVVKVGRRKFIKKIVRVYAASDVNRTYYRFHINQLNDFKKFLSNYGIGEGKLKIKYVPMYDPPSIDYDYIDVREARDYQSPIIDYIVEDGKTKVVTLDPGRGKTFIALRAIRDLSCRVFFCIKPMYIEKWIGDAKEAFKLDNSDILVIRGSSNLKTLMDLADAGQLEAKLIIVSNTTFNKYIKDYERYGKRLSELGYRYNPVEIYERLGIGLKVIDEVHQEFHGNFKQDLYGHVPKTLSLSGTLLSEDPFINKVYSIVFPYEQRYNENVRKVFLGVEAIFYQIDEVDRRVKYTNYALKSYSHILFEQSVMRQKDLLKAYTDMIIKLSQTRYARLREDGQKLLIYCSTVEMCTHVATALKPVYPTLEVTRYVSEDEYSEMIECDVIVSTLKSLGTAIDIPGLRVVILTDALSSMQANLQCSGRLREMKGEWEHITPEFLYLVCANIEKHLDYHRKKKDIFKGRVVYHRETYSEFKL